MAHRHVSTSCDISLGCRAYNRFSHMKLSVLCQLGAGLHLHLTMAQAPVRHSVAEFGHDAKSLQVAGLVMLAGVVSCLFNFAIQ